MSEVVTTRLTELEEVIDHGLHTFVDVGNAIQEIRDDRLYKEEFATFEEYCQKRWGWGRNYANKQIEAANTIEILGTNVPISNEAQARELAPLIKSDPEAAKEVLAALTEEHGDSMKAKHVKKAVAEVREAGILREALPSKTKAVVESSDPEDHSLSRNPAQLRHLKNVAEKRGDDKAAELALRVADGEFRSTFDAYEAMAGEVGDVEVDKSAIVKITKLRNIEYVVEYADGASHTVPRKTILEQGWKKCKGCKGHGVTRPETGER